MPQHRTEEVDLGPPGASPDGLAPSGARGPTRAATEAVTAGGSIAVEGMSRDERSCLLYLETCAVDAGGIVEGVRLNGADHAAIQRFADAGMLQFARVPARMLGTGYRDTWTHIVRFHDAAWVLAHQLRRQRGLRHGPFAEEAIADLEARGRFTPLPASTGDTALSDQSASKGSDAAQVVGDRSREAIPLDPTPSKTHGAE